MKPAIFIDTDVCVDFLTSRTPHHEMAAEIFDRVYTGEIAAVASSLTFVNIHYLLRKKIGGIRAKQVLIRFKSFVAAVPVTDEIIEQALSSEFTDFEDAVQYYAALKAQQTCIVTRNVRDYKKSTISVYDPEDYLKNFA